MPHPKLSKKCFWDKEIEKQTKIATHMDLWKYGQILTIQKSLTIKWLKFSKNKFFMWVYHHVLHYICDFKSPLLLTNEFVVNK
jgi:hypothetical protein